MNTATLLTAGLGCLGGLTRSIVGLLKAHARHDKIKFKLILRTMRYSIISGTFIGTIFYFNPFLSYIAGYVGSDILEGFYNSLKKTKIGKRII